MKKMKKDEKKNATVVQVRKCNRQTSRKWRGQTSIPHCTCLLNRAIIMITLHKENKDTILTCGVV